MARAKALSGWGRGRGGGEAGEQECREGGGIRRWQVHNKTMARDRGLSGAGERSMVPSLGKKAKESAGV